MPQTREIHRILIANRGEIAVRIINTCKKLCIDTVCVYSDADADSLYVKLATVAVHVGSSVSSESYLNIDRIIAAAKKTHADAIHPGYGFLSENSKFAQRCIDEGIIFIGPSPAAIDAMGSKIQAKLILKDSPIIPLIPGYQGEDQTISKLKSEAIKIGFPVLLKASAGGGGKGMRIVTNTSMLDNAIASVKSEALNSFGDESLLIEKYFERVKHIEIQIFGDQYGNCTHIFERECSVQRRHQKVIEECPCATLREDIRQKMINAAVSVGKSIRYSSAGTVEFIFDQDTGNFYFLEVNTRLQVEHPVTEEVTGLDLVNLQIQIAKGFSLTELHLDDVKLKGHAIEARLYAEDPSNNFYPAIGKIVKWKPSSVANVRYDSGICNGSEISVFYDPMISKITAWAPTRPEAINKLKKAIQESIMLGVQTNKKFLLRLLTHPNFVDGSFNTHFIENNFPPDYLQNIYNNICKEQLEKAIIFATLADWHTNFTKRTLLRNLPSGWRNNKSSSQIRMYKYGKDSEVLSVHYAYIAASQKELPRFVITINDETHQVIVSLNSINENGELSITVDDLRLTATVVAGVTPDVVYVQLVDSEHCVTFERIARLNQSDQNENSDLDRGYVSPMPARILKILIKDGDHVEKETELMSIESMKMENKIFSQTAGKVVLYVKEGELVQAGTVLLEVQPETSS